MDEDAKNYLKDGDANFSKGEYTECVVDFTKVIELNHSQ